jgi:23S rRNA (uracil1939-C5)-methyltransferase
MFPIQVNQLITLDIHALGSSGEGIGYFNGFTLFVDVALPGERVEARVISCHPRFGRAALTRIISPSKDRAAPICPLFGTCGGCQIMHLAYPEQLKRKRQRVIDALTRIGKLTSPEVLPCRPSPSPLHYRNKIQLPVIDGKMGLYAKGSHDLVEVKTCYIHCPLGEQVYQELGRFIPSFPSDLTHVLIKSAVNTGEALVVLVHSKTSTPSLKKLAQEILASCPAVKGVIHNCQPKAGNTILGQTTEILAGAGSIKETLNGLNFKVSPASFFQVNPAQAENLYNFALECASLTGQETVLDAYCGVGTLALIFAKKAKKVIGIECVPEAILDAKENAALNNIGNAVFICSTAEKAVGSLSKIDIALLNPPRKGCDPAVLDSFKRLSPKKIVYISCDPATLARDLAELIKMGFAIEKIQPFDMFPQTAHVECVVCLHKNK